MPRNASTTTSSPLKRTRQPPNDEKDADQGSNKKLKLQENSNSEVDELLSYLDCTGVAANDDDGEVSWRKALDKHFSSSSFSSLAKFVAQQRQSKTVFPPAPETFSALNWTPLDQVKVVIVGQDPYHGPKQAHGLCFSVKRGEKIPPSLRNIYKELVQDKEITNFTTMPTHGYLERWAKQGVLMINTVLTVRQGEANSHKNKGWEIVTDEIIRAVDRRSKTTGNGIVFLLWGRPATDKTKTALGGSSSSRHHIICTSHPSPLGATKTNSPFLGSKCFSRANQALKTMGHDEIDWSL